MLQQKLAERTKLLSQLEQAKMQETVAQSLEGMSELAAPGNTPSLDEVREKIERRYANAMGRAELASNSVEGRMLEVQKSTLDMAGRRAWSRSGRAWPAANSPAAPSGGHRRRVRRLRRHVRGRDGDASVARLDEIRRSVSQGQDRRHVRGRLGRTAGGTAPRLRARRPRKGAEAWPILVPVI